jgi:endonuclease/exonuclease/phosphatase family metal-dependent hydrolase
MWKNFIITAILTGVFMSANAQQISVMTYNIRFDNPKDFENRWDMRKNFLVNQLKFYEPGILGTQEGLYHQVEFLAKALKDYQYFGVGRDNGEKQGEFSAVYYDTTKFKVLEHSTFWLSETPGEVSTGWDAALERICSYGYFEDKKTGRQFWVFNTHFDHVGDTARAESVDLILRKMDALNKENDPVILMGDFNLEPTSPPIHRLTSRLKDAAETYTKVSFGPGGTYNAFDYTKQAKRRIDYIFVSGDIEVRKYGVLRDSKNYKFPSDHFPVYGTLRFGE